VALGKNACDLHSISSHEKNRFCEEFYLSGFSLKLELLFPKAAV
jgi:hypothetical protein